MSNGAGTFEIDDPIDPRNKKFSTTNSLSRLMLWTRMTASRRSKEWRSHNRPACIFPRAQWLYDAVHKIQAGMKITLLSDWGQSERPCLENPNMITHGLRLARALFRPTSDRHTAIRRLDRRYS